MPINDASAISSEDRFPRPIQLVHGEDQFKPGEVGINHPNTSAFVRLRDNGDLEIWAAEGLGMIFNVAKKSAIIVADNIKFMTKEGLGLRWNNQYFNDRADTFQEPALIAADDQSAPHVYKGVSYFLTPDQPNA